MIDKLEEVERRFDRLTADLGNPDTIASPEKLRKAMKERSSLEKLVELKLASGMTNPGRIRDLADVQELIRVLRLDAAFTEKLDPYVRPKYAELWSSVQSSGR